MTEQEVVRNREKAYEETVNSLINLVNAITEERNYYCNRCSEIIEEEHTMTPEYHRAINDVMCLIDDVEDGDLDFIIRKLEYMLENDEKYSNT